MTIRNRFEAKYVKVSSGCWEWIAGRTEDGYGYFRDGKRGVRAHRFSYELYIGKIPDGMLVLHRCNNRKCVNPEHIYIGTQAENIRDSIAAGTHCSVLHEDRRGQMASLSKLDNDDVVHIKTMLKNGIKQWLIAWVYQVRRSTIGNINTGYSWSHIRI